MLTLVTNADEVLILISRNDIRSIWRFCIEAFHTIVRLAFYISWILQLVTSKWGR